MNFTSQGSWVPATPAKPIPSKRPLIPVSGSTSQADVPNGLEQIGVSAGFHEISTSWGLASQLQDASGNEGAPALASASHADCHNVGQRPPAFNNPMDRWAHATPYGSLLAAADATATSRRLSLMQFMVAQIRCSQGMAAAPNQLLRNGNLSLPRIHSNGNNHHLRQISQYGFPVPVLPDLNSLPEKMASTGMSETMCPPSTPLTLDKNKRIQNSPPREVIDLVDESVSDGTMPGQEISMLQPNAGETEGLSSPNPVLLSQVVSSQQQEGEKNVIMQSEGTSLQQPEIGDRRGDIQGIDFSKSPQPKPRKKKHRPKVIKEGKPARTPKSVTPKPITPKQARKKESPTGKRKYVRKKTVPNSSETPSYPLGEIVDPESVTVSKSVKRHLDFDSEEPQVRDGLLRSPLVFARNEVQDQDACASGTITSSGAQSVVSSAQVLEAVLENSPEGITFDLSSSVNQMANKYIRIPETPTPPSQAARRQQMRINHKPHGYIRVVRDPPPTPQPYRREVIMENLKKLARKHDSLMVDGNSDRALETGQTSQLHSSNNLVGESCISRNINFTHANEAINCANRSEGTSRHVPYFPHIHKKKRTEKGQRELSSIAASSLTYIPSNCCKTGVLAQNNCEVFTFSETQRLTALEKQRASAPGCLSLFDQRKTKKRSKAPARANNLTSRNATEDCNNLSTPVKPSGFNNTVANQFSTPEKVFGCNNSQERQICRPRDNQVKVTTKKRTKKEQLHLVKSMSSNTNLMCLEEHEAATCSYGYSRGKKIAQISPSSEISRDKNSHFRVNSLQDYQSSSNFKESLNNISPSGAIVSYEDSVNEIVQRLKCLNINRSREIVTDEVQNALVPYNGGGGMVVPYEGPFNLTKKRRPRPKVDLDPETNRVWKLLMGKESSDEGMDIDKEKWWEEERRIFSGRVDSFIARMRLVQGDRRFSQWKGSVVDSVVGVFLTQNVSDHLSSSAFMTLAARFPLSPKANNSKPSGEAVTKSMENQACCSTPFDDCIKWQENTLGQEPCCQGSLVIPEAEHIEEKEMTNSNESLGSHTGGSIVDYSNGKGLDVRELEIIYQSPDRRTSAPVTVTGSTSLAEAEDRSVEDVVSSQNSVSSSQNSSEYLVQSADHIKLSPLSNSNAEDLTYGGICNGLDSSTSFMELLHMAESTRFPELPSHGNGRMSSTDYCGTNGQLLDLKVNKRTSALNQLDSFNGECVSLYRSNPHPHDTQHDFISVSSNFSQSCHLHHSLDSRLTAISSVNAAKEASLSHLSLTASQMNTTNNCNVIGRCSPSAENLTELMDHEKLLVTSGTIPALETYATLRKQSVEPLSHSGTKVCSDKHSCSHSNLPNKMNEASSGKETFNKCSHLQTEQTIKFQQNEREVEFQVESTDNAVRVQAQMQNSRAHETCLNSHSNLRETNKVVEPLESNLTGKTYSSQNVPTVTKNSASKARKAKAETEKKNYDWDNLRKQACSNGTKMGRSSDRMDSVDWEAVRSADVHEVSETIRERGMNNMLSERIKGFLDRIVTDHGSIDLEWLRDVPPDMAKDYLLSIRGLGLKSVECVRLLTLHHLAFPVDTNVGRICVRLGWVPIQPLPESLQLHLLELYPVLETIQKYIWPRLCKLDQRTLYELHYHMITFGKVFCTKSKPNCNACPMRGECKHFASAFASARFALPGPGEKGLVSSTIPIAFETGHSPVSNPTVLPQLEGGTISREGTILNNCEPIIEEPATPEPEFIETSKSDIEDAFFEDPDEIPHIKLNLEAFTQNIQDYMQAKNMELQGGDISKALVVLTREAASIPMPKLKNVSRLRTEHQVYEIPDSHPLLEGMDQREPDDPSHYLLAIWSPGETAQSTEPPKICCNPQDTSKLCDKKTCFACNNIREAHAQTVRGTLLIPCRTAMRGSFPLNGTYFQVNEVFADHDSSLNPIVVSRQWIWNLPRRTVYFGTSVPTIFRGLTTEGIQHCFWKGFVCVRGFDRTTRAPRPLYARLHFPASKTTRNKKAAATAQAAATAPREEE